MTYVIVNHKNKYITWDGLVFGTSVDINKAYREPDKRTAALICHLANIGLQNVYSVETIYP